jgi:aryl-alcohol dehydrogenase-like predicted oxidoreductase
MWGVPDEDYDTGIRLLRRALELGINFFDTADVYGDGRSERLLARLRRERTEPFHVATKAGRRLVPHLADGYTYETLSTFVDRSRKNLDTDTLELVQLHCPPTDVYYRPEVFDALERLRAEGRIAHYGVSVERVEEGLKALEYEGVQSVQIIFNLFRQRPADRFLAEAAARQVGVLARLPLSSGMLTGKLTRASTFAPDDHRAFNRHGEQFDRGETFSGVDYDTGLEVVDELRRLVPAGVTLAQWAMRWILMFDGVTCAIPGGRSSAQVRENAASAALPPLARETMEAVQAVYDARVRPLVHQRW